MLTSDAEKAFFTKARLIGRFPGGIPGGLRFHQRNLYSYKLEFKLLIKHIFAAVVLLKKGRSRRWDGRFHEQSLKIK